MANLDNSNGIPTPRPGPSSTAAPATSLLRSDSTSATSGLSHTSIPTTGSHPLGTLRVHHPAAAADTPTRATGQPKPATRRQDATAMAATPSSPPLGGDVVLVLDLPDKFTVGYDSISFRAQSFAGVKEIPPGAHFFWAAEDDTGSLRTGFWLVADPRPPDRVHVVQWDRYNDVLGDPASKTEARFQRRDVADILPRLPSYRNPAPAGQKKQPTTAAATAGTSVPQGLEDLREGGMWQRLTLHVTPKVLSRVTGREDGPWHVHTTDRVKGTVVLPAERELERAVSLVAVDSLTFSFTQAERTYATSARGAARTEQALDATAHVLSVVGDPARRLADDDVVGELQLAFLVGMHLGNESCVHQWWHVVLRVALRAYALAAARPSLAAALLRALAAQLEYSVTRLGGGGGSSIFDFGAGLERELRVALTVYGRRLDDVLRAGGDGPPASAAQLDVGDAFAELGAVARRCFGWDLGADYVRAGRVMLEDGEEVELEMDELEAEDERGEFAATVVDTDEDGRQRDLVSWD